MGSQPAAAGFGAGRAMSSPNEVMAELSLNFVHKRLLGAAKGFVGGGFAGAAIGFAGGGGPSKPQRPRGVRRVSNFAPVRRGPTGTEFGATDACNPGFIVGRAGCEPISSFNVAQNIVAPPQQKSCKWPAKIDPNTGDCRIFLGTEPGIDDPSDDFGAAVQGAFGIPALVPAQRSTMRLRCPSGMVLGRDNLCYPTQVLRRDSKFRKWRPGARPILTGGQRRGISRARTAITTAKDAISGLGVTVKKK